MNNNEKNIEKNEKGAALVLALFLLMFFTALTFNMFYIAQNKALRAGTIYLGQKSMSNIDSGANIALFELRMAREYFSNGAGPTSALEPPYIASTPSSISTTMASLIRGRNLSTIVAINLSSQGHYIKTKDIYDFFSRVEIGSNVLAERPLVAGDTILTTDTAVSTLEMALDGSIQESASSRLVKAWGGLKTARTIGGYRKTSEDGVGDVRMLPDDTTTGIREDWEEVYTGTSPTSITYEKPIVIVPVNADLIKEPTVLVKNPAYLGRKYYNIKYTETVTTTTTPSGFRIGTIQPQTIRAVSINKSDWK